MSRVPHTFAVFERMGGQDSVDQEWTTYEQNDPTQPQRWFVGYSRAQAVLEVQHEVTKL